MIDNKPTMILLLNKDIKRDDEILVDYGWESKNSLKQVTLCRCTSQYCHLFMEKDIQNTFINFLQQFQMIQSTVESLQNKTKQEIIQMISSLQKYDFNHNLFQNLINLYIYQFMKNHSKFHPKEGRGNQKVCKECTLELYNIFHNSKKNEWDQHVGNWISIRNKRGGFISLINSFVKEDSVKSVIYFDDDFENLDQSLRWIEGIQEKENDVEEKLKKLVEFYILNKHNDTITQYPNGIEREKSIDDTITTQSTPLQMSTVIEKSRKRTNTDISNESPIEV